MSTTKQNGKFVAYYRINNYRVTGQQLTLEEQQNVVRTYLNGGTWKLIGEYTEIELTRQTRRPHLRDAIALCKDEKATLVIANLDRLYRNAYFLALVHEAGIKIIACDNPLVDIQSIQFLAALAEKEGKGISERVRALHSQAKKAGRRLGSPTPGVGAAASGEVVSIKADRFAEKVMPIITKLRKTGYLSYREIANALNEMGVPTARGGEWFASTVRNAELRQKGGE